jgi:hypothetical protein
MVSARHEVMHRVFREDPTLFVRVIERCAGIRLPSPTQVSVVNTELNEPLVIERRVDTLLLAEAQIKEGRYHLVVESQSDWDDKKIDSLAYYVAYLVNKFKCPVVVLMVCTDSTTARTFRDPLVLGLPDIPTLTLRMVVLGPDNVPAVVDHAQACDDPVVALFSALTHCLDPKVEKILEVLAPALATIDEETAGFMAEFVDLGLGDTSAREFWRRLMTAMTYPYQNRLGDEWREEGRAEGLAEGRAEGLAEGLAKGHREGKVQGEITALLMILQGRGITVTSRIYERVMACTDVDVIDGWLLRAVHATTADEIFGTEDLR